MATLQTFDHALSGSAGVDASAWAANDAGIVCALAAKLTEDELNLLRVVWTDRAGLWQQRCAEALGSARLDQAIELLMDMVEDGTPEVALAALGSLREFAPARFTPAQIQRILTALDATLKLPIEPLHRVVLEAFLATLSLAAAGAP